MLGLCDLQSTGPHAVQAPADVVPCAHPTLAAVPARSLAAKGRVVQLEVLSTPPHQHLLAVHEGRAAVWDLRAQALVAVVDASAAAEAAAAAAVTAAAWLPGSSKGDFATGHADGSVCIWALPAGAGSTGPHSSSKARHSSASQPPDSPRPQLQACLVQQLHVCCSSQASSSPKRKAHRAAPRCHPVRQLHFVAGSVECVAVLGGGEVDRPESLALLPIPEPRPVSVEDGSS
jgi:hypothetical protein